MRIAVALGLTLLLVTSTSHGRDASAGAANRKRAAEARAVTLALFRTLNERRYARTCALLVAGVRDPERCALGLRVGFVWSQEVRATITRVRVRPDGVVVSALAGGVPGRVVLTQQNGRLRVLRLEGA
jgi:hypothetical protein